MSSPNTLALTLKALHIPGTPLILTNVWDALSARTVAALPCTLALATASCAIANAAGLQDHELSFEANLHAIEPIAQIARHFNKPLTVDFQDGYGGRLEEGVRKLIAMGVAGVNIEDFHREEGVDGKEGRLYDIAVAQERIHTVLGVATSLGVPDFVVNARTDALLVGLSIDDAVARGKAYLEAGATSVFIWGGAERGGMTKEEVVSACGALEGRLNVSLSRRKGGLTVRELKKIGVCRISVGPGVMLKVVKAMEEEVRRVVEN